jgi:hypothetical protein
VVYPLALLTAMPLALGLASCADTGTQALSTGDTRKPAAVTSAGSVKLDADKDNDNRTGSYHDSDDIPVLRYGRAMRPSEAQPIAALVARYYQAAAAGDGRTACSLLFAPVAQSLPEEEGSSSSSCAHAIARLFRRRARRLKSEAQRLDVVGVRVEADRGWALLSFGHDRPPGRALLERQGSTWRIAQPFRSEMP